MGSWDYGIQGLRDHANHGILGLGSCPGWERPRKARREEFQRGRKWGRRGIRGSSTPIPPDLPDASSSPSPCVFGNSWGGGRAGRDSLGSGHAELSRGFPADPNKPARPEPLPAEPARPRGSPGGDPAGNDPGNPGNLLPAPGRARGEPQGGQTPRFSWFFPLLQMFLSLFHVVFSLLQVVFPCSRFTFLPPPGFSPSSRFLFLPAPVFFPFPYFLFPLPISSIPAPAFFPFSTFFLPLFQGFSFPSPGYFSFSPFPKPPPHSLKRPGIAENP